ncbi:MAG: transcription-repair coupling factor [Chlamydiales bacterium]|nr:transcription-repair coupling factor [Chlamydiales bacterium]
MLNDLSKSPKVQDLLSIWELGYSLAFDNLFDCSKAALTSLLQSNGSEDVLVVTSRSFHENLLYYDLKSLSSSEVLDLPTWEVLPSQDIKPSPDLIGERLNTLKEIEEKNSSKIVITSLQSALQKLPRKGFLNNLQLSPSTGEEIPPDKLIDTLISLGYKRLSIVQDKGEFSVRGGIVDIFPVNTPSAYRIEFFGDEIESIRSFDTASQRSIEKTNSFNILPSSEASLITKEDKPATIFDYLSSNTLIVFDGLEQLEEKFVHLKGDIEKNKRFFWNLEDFLRLTEERKKLFFTENHLSKLSELKKIKSLNSKVSLFNFSFFQYEFSSAICNSPFISLDEAFASNEEAKEEVTGFDLIGNISKSIHSDEINISLLFDSSREWENIQRKLLDKEITLPTRLKATKGYLSKGFYIHDIKTAIFPTTEFSHRYKIRRQKLRNTLHFSSPDVQEFHRGDYVVHYQNGIGKFLGMVRKNNHLGQEVDFFHIEYSDNTTLFVPLTQAYLLSKFVGVKDEKPRVSKLGSAKWKRQLATTEKSIMGYAADLLEVQARREIKKGFSFPPDGKDTQAFEEEFPYIPTEDQLQAITDVKHDMSEEVSMDRLVCGDVGFGKTEVAIRAAFKAVADGNKQVAILVPTTLLAVQHYETFKIRMQNFPINVALLSRFQSTKESKEILQKLRDHQIDIIIGTHRLTSNDVSFHDLGLLIIDEEQRFGVRVKEKLKKIKSQLDCLTLSATPIPRTLYSSLIGIKNMSQIQTPPQDRLPIKTFICEAETELIKEAIQRELNRDGQIYYIHNRVESIYKEADKLSNLFPHANIVVAHGQLSANEIEDIFHKFKYGQADILVATTIVESGIDIPQANTLIVDRADRYGLADLYQLRGRVGRWNKPAYAYFLTPKNRGIKELATKRLQALLEASSYGGGIKIAMQDLEIRGAGDLLGTSQSGHISSVGFHLYCRLLRQTIDSLKGKKTKAFYHTKIECPFEAKIPTHYIEESSLRLEFYQRLGEAESIQDIDQIISEMEDRFGKYPPSIKWLQYLTRIRLEAAKRNIATIKLHNYSVSIQKQIAKEKTASSSYLFPKVKTPEAFEKEMLKLFQRL